MRKSLIAFLGIALILVGISTLLAQPRPPAGLPNLPPPPGFGDPAGRFVVVKTSGEVGVNLSILLLDTTNGDLYRATESDAKPYKERAKPTGGGLPVPKDGPPLPPKDK